MVLGRLQVRQATIASARWRACTRTETRACGFFFFRLSIPPGWGIPSLCLIIDLKLGNHQHHGALTHGVNWVTREEPGEGWEGQRGKGSGVTISHHFEKRSEILCFFVWLFFKITPTMLWNGIERQHRRLHGMEANGGADWIILTKGTEAALQMWD